MKRSPFAIVSLLLVSAALAWPQSNSSEPQAASGAPQTPNAGAPTTRAPQPPAQAPQSVSPMSQPNTQPPQPTTTTTQQQPTANPASSEPQQPKTEIFDTSATSSGLTTDGHDPVLDPPPLPNGKATLVGGIVTSVDHIRNHMTIRVFAGNRWKIAFDERTHIFHNGAETTQLAIKKGERVYVDTMLDRQKHEVFARNIRVGIPMPAADADGQITELDASRGTVTLRDQINSSPIRFTVDRETKIAYGKNPSSLQELRPGALVHVRFSPERADRGLAREITIIAAPGSAFTFVGKITYLDVHRGTLALENVLDQKKYEIHFDPAAHTDIRDKLAVGSDVRVVAIFEGSRYTAQSITLTKSAAAADKDKE